MPAENLTKLDPRHKAAARLKAQGLSNKAIAAEIGCVSRTVDKWMSTDVMKIEVQRLMVKAEEQLLDRLTDAGLEAIQALTGLMDKPDAEPTISVPQKIDAANSLLDRLPNTARIRDRGESNSLHVHLPEIFQTMPDAELAAYLNRWRAGDVIVEGEPRELPAGE
jgi:hypothetical protein